MLYMQRLGGAREAVFCGADISRWSGGKRESARNAAARTKRPAGQCVVDQHVGAPVARTAVGESPAPASAIEGSSGITIVNPPAEGDAIESSTGPKIIHAPDTAQE
jgi:hypothetical protein